MACDPYGEAQDFGERPGDDHGLLDTTLPHDHRGRLLYGLMALR
jgi:hypothetical protein